MCKTPMEKVDYRPMRVESETFLLFYFIYYFLKRTGRERERERVVMGMGMGMGMRRSGILVAMMYLLQISSSVASSEIQILNAERRIDLTSPIVREYLSLKIENTGASPASQLLLAFPPTQAKHIALLKASAAEGKNKNKNKNKNYVPLDVHSAAAVSSNAPKDAKLFSVSLKNPLPTGQTATFEFLLILTHSLEPFPQEINQADPQLVYYRDSATMLSPYHVKQQITYIKTPTKKVESFSIVDPTNHVATDLKYGPYQDTPPYSYSPILVHFENNHPFVVLEELVRVLEVSHWGNLQVTEHYKLVHAGARHKGIFSRLEYQSRQSSGAGASFKQLLARLPPRVHSVYYRDNIGNISSSHLRIDSQKSELFIEPRYPLFGGWKASFVIGYSLPLEDFLFESPGGQRSLNFMFGSPLLETVVDKLTIKVVLPEGSTKPSAAIPFDVEQLLERSFSYLDVIGRTTVVLKKENVVPEHSVPFQVNYSFNPIFMLAEPLMLTMAFFLFFIACIAYLHVDLSLRKS